MVDNTFKTTAQEALEGGVRYAPLLAVILGISAALVGVGYELNKINESGKLNEERSKSTERLVIANEKQIKILSELAIERSKSTEKLVIANEKQIKISSELAIEKAVRLSLENSLKYPVTKETKSIVAQH